MLKTFEIILDIEKEIYTPAQILFSVSRNDFNSVELQFIVQQDNEPLDLTGKTLELAIRKPSGLVVYQPIEIRDAIKGKAAEILALQAYAEFGMITAEVYIRDTETMIVTSPFYFMSRETIVNEELEELESVDDFSALQEVLFSMDKKPLLVEGIPENIVPEYVGQMAVDEIGKRVFIAHDKTVTGWQILGAGEGGGGGIASWADILGKPAAFPPEAHNHDWAEIENIPAAFPAEAHGHTWNEITEKPAAFPPEAHGHDWADITETPAAYPAEAHNHEILDVNGLQAALDSKANANDAAAPVEHNHEIAEVNGLQTALDSKADNVDLINFSPVEHVHTFAEITEKPAAYPAEAHGHDWDEITGKPAAFTPEIHTHDYVDIQNKPTAFAPEAHRHQWTEIDGKPTTFAPEAHTHDEYLTQPEGDARYALRDAEGGTIQSVDWGTITGDIANQTDLQAALNGKADDADLIPFITEADADLKYSLKTDAPVEHGHTISHIEGLQAEIDSLNAEVDTKANVNHNHTIADTTGLQAALDGKADDADLNSKADLVHTHDYNSITGKPTTFAPAAHNHTIGNVTGLQAALDGKADDADLNGKANAVHTHTYDSITGKPTTFAPAAHVHTIANVTGLQAELDGKAATIHNHTIANVTGLQGALDNKANATDLTGKADVNHNHTIANVTGLQAALDGKAATNHSHDFNSITGKPAAYPAEAHNHTIADTTGLQAALDGKADDADLNAFITEAAADAKYKPIGEASGATTAYVDAADNFIINTLMGGLKLWKGTQAAYDGLTKDPNTLYFITG